MIDLLRNKYGAAHGTNRVPVIRCEICNQPEFCIKDKEKDIVCPSHDGVGAYDNKLKNYNVTIIDFEDFINQFKPSTAAGKGKKCDFILYDDRDAYVILNELSELKSKYLESHEVDGVLQDGKRSHAIKQMQESINKLKKSSDIRDCMNRKRAKIGLFSYKIIEDNSAPDKVRQNMSKFGSVKDIYSNIKADVLSDGFVFEQRIFPVPFKLE